MNTLYLHIGTHKTGTSALQAFLNDNSDYMLRYGFYYPTFINEKYRQPEYGRIGDRTKLIRAVKNGYNSWRYSKYKTSSGNAHQLTMIKATDAFQTYSEILAGLASAEHNVLLSSESYWEMAEKTEYFEQLIRLPYRIKVVVYLRRQDEYLSSVVNQRIKGRGYTVLSYPECIFEGLNSQIPLNYYDELEKIASVIGHENIIVRRYYKGIDIICDFLSVLGIPLSDNCVRPKNVVNPHLTFRCLKIMTFVNKLKLNRYITMFIRDFLLDISSQSDKSHKDLFLWDEGVRNTIMDEYEESNDKVARQYLKEDKLFDR